MPRIGNSHTAGRRAFASGWEGVAVVGRVFWGHGKILIRLWWELTCANVLTPLPGLQGMSQCVNDTPMSCHREVRVCITHSVAGNTPRPHVSERGAYNREQGPQYAQALGKCPAEHSPATAQSRTQHWPQGGPPVNTRRGQPSREEVPPPSSLRPTHWMSCQTRSVP